jgi:hypothetical protein
MLLGFTMVGGPMLLFDWFRNRRYRVVERQIALTDALDGRLGAIVAPVVTKPLFGPWEIQIALPRLRSAALACILSVVDEVFSGVQGWGGRAYRIVLSAKGDSLSGAGAVRGGRPATRWTGYPSAA